MSKDLLNTQKVMNHWISGAEDDFDTMKAMSDAGQNSWALFIGHLMIEKLLKAYFVKVNKDHPPLIHNLLKLAKNADLDLTDQLKFDLTTITAFNINVRYDDYKRSFQKKCTPEFTFEWIKKIRKLRLWILEQIEK